MNVILQENFPALGYVGDTVRVKRGYARNFLIPKGVAVEADSRRAKELNHKLQLINAKKAKLKLEAEELAAKLSNVELKFSLKVGEHGKSFGSVTSKEIENALADKGFEVDKKQIQFTDSLKSAGEHDLPIKLHAEVVGHVKLVIESVGTSKKKEEKPKVHENEEVGSEDGELVE